MKKSELQQIIREELSKTLNENSEKYMFFQNLETIKKEVEEMLSLDPQTVDAILANGHDWAADHISTSKDDIEEVHNFLMSNKAPMDEKKLSSKQMKIAKAAPPEDKITGADFAALKKGLKEAKSSTFKIKIINKNGPATIQQIQVDPETTELFDIISLIKKSPRVKDVEILD